MTTTLTFAHNLRPSRAGARYLRAGFWLPAALIPDEKIAKPVAEVTDLISRWDEAKKAAHEAKVAVEAAEQADVQAAADSLRAGKSAAPKPTEPSAQKKLETAEKQAATLGLAAEGAAQDALAALSEYGPALAAKLAEGTLSKQRKALAAAIEEISSLVAAVEATTALATYLAPANGELASWAMHSARQGRLPRPQVPKNDVLSVYDLVAALRQVVVDAEAADQPKPDLVLAEVATDPGPVAA